MKPPRPVRVGRHRAGFIGPVGLATRSGFTGPTVNPVSSSCSTSTPWAGLDHHPHLGRVRLQPDDPGHQDRHRRRVLHPGHLEHPILASTNGHQVELLDPVDPHAQQVTPPSERQPPRTPMRGAVLIDQSSPPDHCTPDPRDTPGSPPKTPPADDRLRRHRRCCRVFFHQVAADAGWRLDWSANPGRRPHRRARPPAAAVAPNRSAPGSRPPIHRLDPTTAQDTGGKRRQSTPGRRACAS